MVNVLLLGILLLLPTACVSQKVSSRIVGGQDTQAGRWPWQASIGQPGTHNCGGSLISDRWVVSAAHCFPRPINASLYLVRLGVYQLSNPDQTMIVSGVKQVIIHPNYTSEVTSRGDIALLELQTRVNFSSLIRPVCLPSATAQFLPGMNCSVTGWGGTGYLVSLPVPQTLQELQVPIMDSASCNSMYLQFLNQSQSVKLIQNDMMCAGFAQGQKSFCNGDYGGPLVCSVNSTWLLAGVVSWGPKLCAAPLAPGVYSRVTFYIDWIKSYIPDLNCSAVNMTSPVAVTPAGTNSTYTVILASSPAITTTVAMIIPKAASNSNSLNVSTLTSTSASTLSTATNSVFSLPTSRSFAPYSSNMTTFVPNKTTIFSNVSSTRVPTESIASTLNINTNYTSKFLTLIIYHAVSVIGPTSTPNSSKLITGTVAPTLIALPNVSSTSKLNTTLTAYSTSNATLNITLTTTSKLIMPSFSVTAILNSNSTTSTSSATKASTILLPTFTSLAALNVSTTDRIITVPSSNVTTTSKSYMNSSSLSMLSTNITTVAMSISNPNYNTTGATPGLPMPSNYNFTTISTSINPYSINLSTASNATTTTDRNSTNNVSITHLDPSTQVILPASNLTKNNNSALPLSITKGDLVMIIKATVHQFWSQMLQSLEKVNVWSTDEDLLV